MFTTCNNFIRVRNKYCCCSFGNNNDYILMLKHIRPYVEASLPGLQMHIACRDESFYLLQDEPRVTPKSGFDKNNYSFVREVRPDASAHPIQKMLDESQIPIPTIRSSSSHPTHKVYVSIQSLYPCRPVPDRKRESIVREIESSGRRCCMDEPYDGVSSVVATEGELLMAACLAGADCALLDTGVGGRLMRSMFPSLRTIRIEW